jgi:hypothetical protein
MIEAHNTASGRRWGSREFWIPFILGLVALAPYVAYHAMFIRLYWFGDEFDLINQMDLHGFWRWTWLAFSENFVPLFKVLWGGCVLAFGGSYAAMIAIVWLTHALIVVILGRLMRACGLSWTAVLVAQVVFGLAPSNLETLAWSIQWSAMLSVAFMLLAFDSFFRRPFTLAPAAWVAASGLTFLRGVLTGVLLAAASSLGAESHRKRAGYALAYLLPAALVGVLYVAMVPTGNHRHMEGHYGDAVLYGAWYYCMNPAHYLLGMKSVGQPTLIGLGILKVALVGWGIARGRGNTRTLFVLLLAFDLGNAVLLGVGRYHTGLSTAMSSRYQYASLIACLPTVGFWVSHLWSLVPVPSGPRRLAFSVLLAATAIALCHRWPTELDAFTAWRGTDSRRLLHGNPDASQAVPGYPGFPMDRAMELIERYDLH